MGFHGYKSEETALWFFFFISGEVYVSEGACNCVQLMERRGYGAEYIERYKMMTRLVVTPTTAFNILLRKNVTD